MADGDPARARPAERAHGTARSADREHAIVLHGATGFTGGLTAEYLARAGALSGCALAGRDRGRLEAVRDRLAAIEPSAAGMALLHADAGDPASLEAMARSARVVISTVGPYVDHGEGVVAACAAAGTGYVDLTGETEFVDRMWLRHHEQAVLSGARLVHSCGFESLVADLGVLWTVSQLPEGVPLSIEAFVRGRGALSGGTYATAIGIMARLRQATAAARERHRREGGSAPGRRVRGRMAPPRSVPEAGGWAVAVPTIDSATVLRSARALDRYGPDFAYTHNLVVGPLPAMAGLTVGVAGMVVVAQVPGGAELLRRLAPSPGLGPSEEQRARGWFEARFEARVGGERRLTATVSGGDPGYGETATMLAESALCLAHDELPPHSGQLTPAVAMGQALIERLRRAGIRFEVRPS